MSNTRLDHVAIWTNTFEWYVNFLTETMGMEITLTDPENYDFSQGLDDLKQAWIGGVQVKRDETFDPASHQPGQMDHIGISTDDVDAVLDKVYAVEGIVQAPDKPRNWFILPDGLMIELIPTQA